MADKFQVPKRKVAGRVTLAGRNAMPISLFLSDCAERHAGPERASDLLEQGAFVPVMLEDGTLTLLNGRAVLILSVPSDVETGDRLSAEDLAAEETVAAQVSMLLADGSTCKGTIVYLMPEAQRRLQDYLNGLPERFVHLWDGDTVHLVNKEQVLQITPHRQPDGSS